MFEVRLGIANPIISSIANGAEATILDVSSVVRTTANSVIADSMPRSDSGRFNARLAIDSSGIIKLVNLSGTTRTNVNDIYQTLFGFYQMG